MFFIKIIALLGLLAFAAASGPFAGAQDRPARIGILGPSEEPRFSELERGLREGLHDHGYSRPDIDVIEGRVQRGDRTAARAMVEDMARKKPKVLFVIGSELARQVRQVSSEIPIVFITPGDPVGSGLVSSLARPGGNMTAMTFEYPELSGKRLELLQEIVPRLRRVWVLYDPRDASPRQGVASVRDAAPKLRITLVERQTQTVQDLNDALRDPAAVDALLAIPGGLTTGHYEKMIRVANDKRIPTMFHSRTKSTTQALASYGANDSEIARQAARIVDKILKGTKAGDIPVERPTKLEFIINLKTAKLIGLAVPPNVLARADKVIK